jgi:hypothetical protein
LDLNGFGKIGLETFADVFKLREQEAIRPQSETKKNDALQAVS